MQDKRKAADEAFAQFWFNGLIEPSRDDNDHVRLRNGEIVWVATYKGAAYVNGSDLLGGIARLKSPDLP